MQTHQTAHPRALAASSFSIRAHVNPATTGASDDDKSATSRAPRPINSAFPLFSAFVIFS